jgi:thermostable 8-oxoguanine DNA glycosylase
MKPKYQEYAERGTKNENERQYLLAFLILVANKPAKRAEYALDTLLSRGKAVRDEELHSKKATPFELLKIVDGAFGLEPLLHSTGIGYYKVKAKGLRYLANSKMNLATCSYEDLLEIPGISHKSASLFLMYSRPNERRASLDTHILRWLKNRGYDVPESTPGSRRRYEEIQAYFIQEADARGMTCKELNASIWIASTTSDITGDRDLSILSERKTS